MLLVNTLMRTDTVGHFRENEVAGLQLWTGKQEPVLSGMDSAAFGWDGSWIGRTWQELVKLGITLEGGEGIVNACAGDMNLVGMAQEDEKERMAKVCRTKELYTLADLVMPDGKTLRPEMQHGGKWRRTAEDKWWATVIEKGAKVSKGGMFAQQEIGEEMEGDREGNWVRGGRTVAWMVGTEKGIGRIRSQSRTAVVVEKWQIIHGGRTRRRSRQRATGSEWWTGVWMRVADVGMRVPISQTFPVDCEETGEEGRWVVTDSEGWMSAWDTIMEEAAQETSDSDESAVSEVEEWTDDNGVTTTTRRREGGVHNDTQDGTGGEEDGEEDPTQTRSSTWGRYGGVLWIEEHKDDFWQTIRTDRTPADAESVRAQRAADEGGGTWAEEDEDNEQPSEDSDESTDDREEEVSDGSMREWEHQGEGQDAKDLTERNDEAGGSKDDGQRGETRTQGWEVSEWMGARRLEVEPTIPDGTCCRRRIGYSDGGQIGWVEGDSKSSYGWWVPREGGGSTEDNATETWAAGGGIVPGNWRWQTSSRAEAYGILQFMRVVREWMEKRRNTDKDDDEEVTVREQWMLKLDNEGVVKRFNTAPETWPTTRWLHTIDRDVWEGIANERERWTARGWIIKVRWVRSHAGRHKRVEEFTGDDVGNHVSDRIASKVMETATDLQISEGQNKELHDRRLRWRVKVHGEEMVGPLRKWVSNRVVERKLQMYHEAKDAADGVVGSALGIDLTVDHKTNKGDRRMEASPAEVKVKFGLWATGAREASFEKRDAPACPVCGEGTDTHSHVVCECRHERMVECRRKWCERVWKTMERKMRGWEPRENWGDAKRLACSACVLRADGTVRDLMDEDCIRATLGDWSGVEGDEAKLLRRGGTGEGSDDHAHTWMALMDELIGLDAAGSTAEQRRRAKKAGRVVLSKQWREMVCMVWKVRGSKAVEMINEVAKVVMRGHQELWKVRCELLHSAGSKAGERAQVEEEVEQAMALCEKRWTDEDWMGRAMGTQGISGLRTYVQSLSLRAKRKWVKKVRRTKLAKSQPQIQDFRDFVPTPLPAEIEEDRARRLVRMGNAKVEEKPPAKRQTTLLTTLLGAVGIVGAVTAEGSAAREARTPHKAEGEDTSGSARTPDPRQMDIRQYARGQKRRKVKLGYRDSGTTARCMGQRTVKNDLGEGGAEDAKADVSEERDQLRVRAERERDERARRRAENNKGAVSRAGGSTDEHSQTCQETIDRLETGEHESSPATGKSAVHVTETPREQKHRRQPVFTNVQYKKTRYGRRPARPTRRHCSKTVTEGGRPTRTTHSSLVKTWVAKDSGEGQSDGLRGRKRVMAELRDGTCEGRLVDYEKQYELDTVAD